MAELENHLRPQHDIDDCLSSCIHGILSHFADESSELESDLENISYSQVNQTITPNKGIEPTIYTPPHVENYDDFLNQRLFKDFSIWVRNSLHNNLDDLREVIEDDNTSLPIISFHPDYFKWQRMNNDNKAHYRHAVVVKEINSQKAIFQDPMAGRFKNISFKLEMPITKFKELWGKIVRDNYSSEDDGVANEIIYIEKRETEPGQTRL